MPQKPGQPFSPDNPPRQAGRLYGFQTDEHYTGAVWVDNRPVFRRVIEFFGGSNSSQAVNALPNIDEIDLITSASWALQRPGLSGSLDNIPARLSTSLTTGTMTVSHSGANYSGIPMHIIAEYVKF